MFAKKSAVLAGLLATAIGATMLTAEPVRADTYGPRWGRNYSGYHHHYYRPYWRGSGYRYVSPYYSRYRNYRSYYGYRYNRPYYGGYRVYPNYGYRYYRW